MWCSISWRTPRETFLGWQSSGKAGCWMQAFLPPRLGCSEVHAQRPCRRHGATCTTIFNAWALTLHTPPCPHRRSLGYLVNRNQPEQLQAVVAQLCDKLTDGSKEQLRDVASLGLKTVVAGAGAEEATAVEHESHTTGMACWLAGVGSLASSQMDVALPARIAVPAQLFTLPPLLAPAWPSSRAEPQEGEHSCHDRHPQAHRGAQVAGRLEWLGPGWLALRMVC